MAYRLHHIVQKTMAYVNHRHVTIFHPAVPDDAAPGERAQVDFSRFQPQFTNEPAVLDFNRFIIRAFRHRLSLSSLANFGATTYPPGPPKR